jgi:hypothetical protein
MRSPPALAIMLSMNSPIAHSRVVLIADRRPSSPGTGGAPVRRFRLARLGLDVPSVNRAAFAAHGKRTNG